MEHWDNLEVLTWLASIRAYQYIHVFKDKGIVGGSLYDIDEPYLKKVCLYFSKNIKFLPWMSLLVTDGFRKLWCFTFDLQFGDQATELTVTQLKCLLHCGQRKVSGQTDGYMWRIFEKVVVRWCKFLTLLPERSGGQHSVQGRASPFQRHDKGSWTRVGLSYLRDCRARRYSRNFISTPSFVLKQTLNKYKYIIWCSAVLISHLPVRFTVPKRP